MKHDDYPEIPSSTWVVPEGPADALKWTVVVNTRCECWAAIDGRMVYLGAEVDDGAGGRRFIPAEGDG